MFDKILRNNLTKLTFVESRRIWSNIFEVLVILMRFSLAVQCGVESKRIGIRCLTESHFHQCLMQFRIQQWRVVVNGLQDRTAVPQKECLAIQLKSLVCPSLWDQLFLQLDQYSATSLEKLEFLCINFDGSSYSTRFPA